MRRRWPFITLIIFGLPLLAGVILMLAGWEAEVNRTNVRLYRLTEKPKNHPKRYQAIGVNFIGTNAFCPYWVDRTVMR